MYSVNRYNVGTMSSVWSRYKLLCLLEYINLFRLGSDRKLTANYFSVRHRQCACVKCHCIEDVTQREKPSDGNAFFYEQLCNKYENSVIILLFYIKALWTMLFQMKGRNVLFGNGLCIFESIMLSYLYFNILCILSVIVRMDKINSMK